MKKTTTFYTYIQLFLTFLKIGALTFGGGYAMIPIIERDVVEKRKWVTQIEMLDILAISESTPGPISVNAATYIGYKVGGFFGSFVTTLGLALPSFIIILLISFIYEKFLSWKIIQAAFLGLKVGVVILLFNAVYKLKKGVTFSIPALISFIITLGGTLVSFFLDFNLKIGTFNLSLSIIFIVSGLIIGIITEVLSKERNSK